MGNNQAKKITDGAMLIGIYIVLLLLSLFVPGAILLGIFMMPIPFVLYTYRHSYQAAIVMLVAVLGLSFIFATLFSLPLTILTGLGGIVIGESLKKELSAYRIWTNGTIAFIIGLLINIVLLYVVLKVNIYEQISVMIEESLDMSMMMMSQLGLAEPSAEQMSLVEGQMQLMADLLPASIVILSMIMAFLALFLSFKLLNRIAQKEYYFPPFKQFNLPKGMIFLYLIVSVGLMIISNQNGSVYLALINSIAILVVLFVIQGFSFIFFFTNYKAISPIVPVVIVIFSILMPIILLLFIQFIGIIDSALSLKLRVANMDKK